MTVLYGSLAVLFVMLVAELYWPRSFTTATQFLIAAIVATAWALLFATDSIKLDLLQALAICGASEVLHSAYRLVRAWADRIEAANILPIRRGQV